MKKFTLLIIVIIFFASCTKQPPETLCYKCIYSSFYNAGVFYQAPPSPVFYCEPNKRPSVSIYLAVPISQNIYYPINCSLNK